MLEKVINFALNRRGLVFLAVAALVIAGFWSAINLPIDAIPDVTNVQVQINTNTVALSPIESERQVTIPIENAMFGIQNIEQVRSLSKFGLSQVTVVFKEGTDIYFARQQIQERLAVAKEELPAGIELPEIGPLSSGLGEIFQYSVVSDSLNATELRTLHDWVIAPQMRSVSGIAEVNTFGGLEKQYQVVIRPHSLLQFGVTLQDVIDAISNNNVNGSGGYMVRGAEQLVVRGIGQVSTIEQIGNTVVTTNNAVPVKVKDVADVTIGSTIRQGAVTQDAKGEVVTGIAMMRLGANARTVVGNVKERIASIQQTLSSHVRIVPFYDRSELINSTIATVKKNLFEGAVFVIVVLFAMLGNFRGALIVAMSIPLSMLFALTAMQKAGLAGSLMSLGAIDFGLVVDGSVVMVENAIRRLSHDSGKRSWKEHFEIVKSSCSEVAKPIFFGVTIIIVVYLPILSLQGVEGKMFRPMALTVVFALIGSLLLTFVLTPVLILLGMRKEIKEGDVWLIRKIKPYYQSILDRVLANSRRVLVAAAMSVVAALSIVPFLGAEFIPRLDEGAFAIQIMRLPSVSLDESVRHSTQVERILLDNFPDEIRSIVSKTGRPEIATDPMGVNISDVFVMLNPRSEWTAAKSAAELERQMMEVLDVVPGIAYTFSQPIELRVNELVAGVRSDLAIKIFGEELDTLAAISEEIAAMANSIDGAVGFKMQQTTELPQLEVSLDQAKLAQYGVSAQTVMQHLNAINGIEATQIYEGQRRFSLAVKYPEEVKQGVHTMGNLIVSSPAGMRVPLSELSNIAVVNGISDVNHEDGSRLSIIEGNVRGRDIGSFVQDVRDSLEKKREAGLISIPNGYRIDFGGQFENLERATHRLLIVVPISLVLIFLFLYSALHSVKLAALVFTGIPFAAVGGLLALLVRGMPLSISAGVGFIALFGVAVLNGLVLISCVVDLRNEGRSLLEAIKIGCMSRLRPVLTTGLVASLGFLPMALSGSAGAEVQRPLATVVIGGLITSTILTLLVLPVLYYLANLSNQTNLDNKSKDLI